MRNKKMLYIKISITVITILILAILCYLIPVRVEERTVWHSTTGPGSYMDTSYGTTVKIKYNIFNIQISPSYEVKDTYDVIK